MRKCSDHQGGRSPISAIKSILFDNKKQGTEAVEGAGLAWPGLALEGEKSEE
jgi:hypothetical protein